MNIFDSTEIGHSPMNFILFIVNLFSLFSGVSIIAFDLEKTLHIAMAVFGIVNLILSIILLIIKIRKEKRK